MVVKSKVKYIQSLSQKKQRDADGVFIAEGPKIINELLYEPRIQPLEVFALKNWLTENEIPSGIQVTEIDEVMLSRLTQLSTPNQVVGLFKIPEAGIFRPQKKVSLLLDNIQDPGNLGSIVRCADWFGVEHVVCSRDCADVFNPKCVQSTMGSLARVRVFYEDLENVIKTHPEVPLYAATLDGTDIGRINPPREAMILIGNESKGINKELLEFAAQKITIPRIGKAESLNAAVATGILLSQLTR